MKKNDFKQDYDLLLSRNAALEAEVKRLQQLVAVHIEIQISIGDKGQGTPKETEAEPQALPPQLSTERAMALWKKAQDAGYVDANYQPLISRTQAALLANAMAERLGIREKWKVFGGIWHRTKMYKDYYQALEQKQSLLFQDKLKLLLE